MARDLRAGSDKPLRWFAKCVHCGKAENQHRSGDQMCPRGKRRPTGYAEFLHTRFKAKDEQQ